MRKVLKYSCLLLFCTILLVGSRVSSAQTAPQQAWLERIPSSSRERLAVRLHQYVEYEGKRQYEKLYELFSESALKSFRLRTKEDYAKARRDSSFRVLSFKPLSSGYDEAMGVYVIGGEAEIDENGEITKQIVNMNATLHNGDWYLSELYLTLGNPGGIETLTTTTPTLNNEPEPKKPQKVGKPFR